MANATRKIQDGVLISDKVIPDKDVQAVLLSRAINFRYIGVEEYPHVSLNSYYELARELISHHKTCNFKLFVCDSETKPDRKLLIHMGYWRCNPMSVSWKRDFIQYPWLESAQNFSIKSGNHIRLCSIVELSNYKQLGSLLEISLFRNAIFIPENKWSNDLYNLIYDSLLDRHIFLMRNDYLKLMISRLSPKYKFFLDMVALITEEHT